MGEEQEKKVVCLQPEYVGKFQCDGAACNSKCCRGWGVDIDGPTYQRYCTIEPKDERKRIVSRIKYKKQQGKFFVAMNKDGACPFLRSDGLCKIQKTWGADWLSNTCTIYPRTMYLVGNLLLRGLVLTCPVAAKLALLPKEPMIFEEVPLLTEEWEMLMRRSGGRLAKVGDGILDIQYGAVSILQNRALTIDQRLIVLGFFLDQAGDMVEAGETEKIEVLSAVYTADDFMERVPEMLQAITFRPVEYVKSMFGLIETLYGKKSEFWGRENALMKRLVHAFGMEKGEIPLTFLLETYRDSFRPAEEKLLREYGYIFENYLVNEFFMNHYPLVIAGTIVQNYILFVMDYKLLEFMAVVSAMEDGEKTDEESVIKTIVHMVASLAHSRDFLTALANDTLKRQKDVVSCMKNLLCAGDEYSA